jgi:phage gp36-like protein
MSYATVQEVIDRLGEDELWGIAGDDGEGNLNTATIDIALADATEEIDSAIRVRYRLPLATVPGIIKRICIDKAVALIPSNGAEMSDLIKERDKTADKRLNEIARGVRQLDLVEAPRNITGGGVLISVPDSPFSEDKLKGF